LTHKNAPKNFQLSKTFLNIEQKVGKIRKVLYFENEIEHKILVTYVIAKVSAYGTDVLVVIGKPTTYCAQNAFLRVGYLFAVPKAHALAMENPAYRFQASL